MPILIYYASFPIALAISAIGTFLCVTGTFLCDLRVSDRFSEYKENPENTGFSGSVALFRYSVELSLC